MRSIEPDHKRPSATVLGGIAGDLKYCFRRLRKRRAFALTVILTLGLGIGANVAVFSLANALLVKGLPYTNAGRLVLLNGLPLLDFMDSAAAFERWKADSDLLEDAALYGVGTATFLGGSEPQQLHLANVTSNLFDVLGVRPRAGRSFLPADAIEGQTSVVMVSEKLWRSQLGGDNSILGNAVRLNGESYTVVGVVPAGCDFPAATDVWTPTANNSLTLSKSHAVFSSVLGLRKQDATVAQVDAQQRSWLEGRHLNQGDDPVDYQASPVVRELRSALVENQKRPVLLLFGAVMLVLLIGCANVMSIVLVDAGVREHEFQIRRAVGMSTARLVRQLFTEHLLIGILGGAAGVAMAYLSLPYLKTYVPKDWHGLADVSIDMKVLVFAIGISLGAGLIVGLAPCLRFSGSRRHSFAHTLGARVTETRAGRLGREAILCVETGLAMVLLVASALFIQTLNNLIATDCGFNPRGVLAVTVSRDTTNQQAIKTSQGFYRDVMDRLRSLPGVEAVGGVDYLPSRQDMEIVAQATTVPARADAAPAHISLEVAAPGYFDVMSIPLLAGRDFSAIDDETHPAVTIVARGLADKLWPDGDVIGRQISIDHGPPLTVIGVVRPIRVFGPSSEGDPGIYRPLAQSRAGLFSFVIRYKGQLKPVESQVISAIRATDPEQPIEVGSMESYVGRWSQSSRSITGLLSILSGLGLVLATVGAYGLVSYSIGSRSREFGIRIVLGERSPRIAMRSVAGAARAILPGLGLGAAMSVAAGKVFESELYGVRATSPATMAAMGALFLFVAGVASILAARRALFLDPIEVLRHE